MASTDTDYDTRFGKAVMRGILIGMPVMFIVLSLGIWLITDNTLVESIETAVLPGVLLGAFAGGFTGMATVMD